MSSSPLQVFPRWMLQKSAHKSELSEAKGRLNSIKRDTNSHFRVPSHFCLFSFLPLFRCASFPDEDTCGNVSALAIFCDGSS